MQYICDGPVLANQHISGGYLAGLNKLTITTEKQKSVAFTQVDHDRKLTSCLA